MRIFYFLGLIFLSSCSSLETLKSTNSEYESYVNQHLKGEVTLHERGELLLSVKALVADQGLYDRQEKNTPGKAFPIKAKTKQVFVALHYPRDPSFSLLKVSFLLNDQKAEFIREIDDLDVLQGSYFFAYPFYRLFLLSFGEGEWDQLMKLKLQTPSGTVELLLGPEQVGKGDNG